MPTTAAPWFPGARVDIARFMRVDAMFHMMLETVAQLRKAGADETDIKAYRWEAIYGDPWATTARWVTIGPTSRSTS